MLRIIEEPKEEKSRIIEMKDMEPLQVGRIVDERADRSDFGKVVMRTASTCTHEVIDLTAAKEGFCWTGGTSQLEVELLTPGESITIELFNEE